VTWKRPLGGRDNSVVVGGDVENLDFTRIVTVWPDLVSEFSLVNPGPGNRATTPGVPSAAQQALVTRTSVYAEDRLKVTRAMALVGGIRYDHQQWGRVDLMTPESTRIDRNDNPVNWRVGTVYEIVRNTNVYAQFSKATDRGSYLAEATIDQMALRPARSQQFEAGVKQSTYGGRLEWTLAGYHIVKNDLVTFNPNVVPVPGQPFAPYIQVGAQSSRGVEGSVALDTGRGLRIGANGALLDPVFDDFYEDVDGVPTSRNGNRPYNVPWQSGNVFATWAFQQQWLAQATVRYVGERYVDTANTMVLPSYTVIDAGLRWSASPRLAIDFRVGNLSNAFYPINSAGGGNWLVGGARSFELGLTTGF
jgi:iron complex outermembrane receptor protein